MSYTFDPGFGRGHVLGARWNHPIEKTDPTVTGASVVLTTKEFTDVHAKTGAVLSPEIVTCLAVRNPDAPGTTPWAPGAAKTVAGYKGVVDEYLPKVTGTGADALGGCEPGEVCWLVIQGPYTDPATNKRQRINVVNGTAAPVTRLLADGTEEEVEVVVDPAADTDATTTTPTIP
jgi:hypothetical protein